MSLIFDAAWWMALVPLAWLSWLRLRGRVRDVSYWWLAAAFAISFVADAFSRFLPNASRLVISLAYPMTQALLVLAVLVDRGAAFRWLAFFVVAGLVAIVVRDPASPDWILRTVTSGAVVLAVWDRWALGRLRVALLVYFGAGLACWLCYVALPGWSTWAVYQLCRLAGLLLFCWASSVTTAQLRLSRSTVRG